jgi:ribonucleoside-diphosphate reductase alpha chain
MERNKVLEYFEGDELATDVWIDKYRLDNENTPDDTIQRIAKEFYRIESHYMNGLSYDTIYGYLKGFKYIIPAGSPLNGIGNTKALTSLSNCYVIDSPIDSYAGILKTDEELVQLMKRRGGVGVDISSLRPEGSPVNNAAISSTGAVSFMNRYSNTTKEVAQGGRRGALIITMNVDHQDIDKFITSKDDLSKINGANISVKITDEFMQKVIDKDEKSVKIWKLIAHQAWKTAEPGILFWDKIISESHQLIYIMGLRPYPQILVSLTGLQY